MFLFLVSCANILVPAKTLICPTVPRIIVHFIICWRIFVNFICQKIIFLANVDSWINLVDITSMLISIILLVVVLLLCWHRFPILLQFTQPLPRRLLWPLPCNYFTSFIAIFEPKFLLIVTIFTTLHNFHVHLSAISVRLSPTAVLIVRSASRVSGIIVFFCVKLASFLSDVLLNLP